MDENPYKPPAERDKKPPDFLRWPTVIEWVVIIALALAVGALLLPNVDDGTQKALQRVREHNASRAGPLRSRLSAFSMPPRAAISPAAAGT